MPQLVPSLFLSQVVFAFAIFVTLVFVFSKYILPRFVRLFATRVFTISRNYNTGSLIRFYILTLLSTYVIIIPIKVTLGISGILGTSVLTTIITILLNKFFFSLYKNNSLPNLYSIFFSILMYFFIFIFIHPLVYLIFDFLDLIDFINLRDYLYLFCHLIVLIFEGEFILLDGVYMAKRTPELTQELRAKRNDANKLDYYCIKAYGNYMDEKNLLEKNKRLKELFKLVGELRDVKNSIDSLANNNRLASRAFHNKDYAIYVSKVIYFMENKKK